MTDKHQPLRDALKAGPTQGAWRIAMSNNGTPIINHEHGHDQTDPGDLSSRVCAMPAEIAQHFNSLANARLIAAANPAAISAILADLDAAVGAMELVRDALKRHGQHDRDCATKNWRIGGLKCSCGLDAALSQIKAGGV